MVNSRKAKINNIFVCTVPTGSPVSETSEDSDPVDPPVNEKQEQSSEPQAFVSIKHAKKRFG